MRLVLHLRKVRARKMRVTDSSPDPGANERRSISPITIRAHVQADDTSASGIPVRGGAATLVD